jgi:hypothetical protein
LATANVAPSSSACCVTFVYMVEVGRVIGVVQRRGAANREHNEEHEAVGCKNSIASDRRKENRGSRCGPGQRAGFDTGFGTAAEFVVVVPSLRRLVRIS